MEYTVYKLTNQITNQIYFGYTSQRLKSRIHGHKQEPRPTLISRSIQKYGIDSFKVEIVDVFEIQSEAVNHEIYLIAEHKTNHLRYPSENGLNMTDGGEGVIGYKHTELQKQKWRKERQGMNAGDKHPAWGKFGGKNPASKSIYLTDVSGNVTKFDSIVEAAAHINVHPSNISKCCSDKYPTAHKLKGYSFSRTSP